MTDRIKVTGPIIGDDYEHQVTHLGSPLSEDFNNVTGGGWKRPYPYQPGEPIAARVAILEPVGFEEGVTTVAIDTQPSTGHVHARSDGRIAIVLSEMAYNASGTTIAFDYTVTGGASPGAKSFSDATVASVQVKGWDLAKEMYSLGLDAAFGALVVEHGRDYVYNTLENGTYGHRKVYVSGAPVHTEADIVAWEQNAAGGNNPSFVADDITGNWLAQNTAQTGIIYGLDKDNSIDEVSGQKLWRWLTDSKNNSHWLLLERGYDYNALARVLYGTSQGESARHPIRITSYGTGDRPNIKTSLTFTQATKAHIVVDAVNVRGTNMAQVTNCMLYDVGTIPDDGTFGWAGQWDLDVDRLMVMGCHVFDSAQSVGAQDKLTEEGIIYWSPKNNRISGAHHGNFDNGYPGSEGSQFFIDNIIDHCGWQDGYDKGYRYYDAATNTYWPQAPSQYNHNMYLQDDGPAVTARRNWTSRSSFTGTMQRQGSVNEDTISFNNPVGVSLQGGDYKDRGPLAYSSYINNLLHHIASERNVTAKDVSARKARGMNILSVDTTEIDVMITHMYDPADTALEFGMWWGDTAYSYQGIGYNFYQTGRIVNMWLSDQADGIDENGDPIVANGKGSDNEGTEGMDPAALAALTAMVWLEDVKLAGVGGRKDITDVSLHFRTTTTPRDDFMSLMNFMRSGFGKSQIVLQGAADTYEFNAQDFADGMRWDMRDHWSPVRVPGYASTGTDDVDLMGAKVLFPYETVEVGTLTFGEFGELHIAGGKITATTLAVDAAGNTMSLRGVGELELAGGYTSANVLTVGLTEAGRIRTGANTVSGAVDVTMSDDAQLVIEGGGTLATTGDITLNGPDVRLGADDTAGTAALTFAAGGTLTMTNSVAYATPPIAKFRSGLTGDTAQSVTFNVVCAGTLDMTGAVAGEYDIIEATSVTGTFSVTGGSAVYTGTTVTVTVT